MIKIARLHPTITNLTICVVIAIAIVYTHNPMAIIGLCFLQMMPMAPLDDNGMVDARGHSEYSNNDIGFMARLRKTQ